MNNQTYVDWLRSLFRSHSFDDRIDAIAAKLSAQDKAIATLTAERDRLRAAVEEYARDYGRGGDTARTALKGETE